jgi:hypothetical protein
MNDPHPSDAAHLKDIPALPAWRILSVTAQPGLGRARSAHRSQQTGEWSGRLFGSHSFSWWRSLCTVFEPFSRSRWLWARSAAARLHRPSRDLRDTVGSIGPTRRLLIHRAPSPRTASAAMAGMKRIDLLQVSPSTRPMAANLTTGRNMTAPTVSEGTTRPTVFHLRTHVMTSSRRKIASLHCRTKADPPIAPMMLSAKTVTYRTSPAITAGQVLVRLLGVKLEPHIGEVPLFRRCGGTAWQPEGPAGTTVRLLAVPICRHAQRPGNVENAVGMPLLA